DVGSGFQRLVDGVAVPDGVLECTAAIVTAYCGPAAQTILDALNATSATGRLFGDEGAAIAGSSGQVGGNVSELGRIVRGKEQNVTGRPGVQGGMEGGGRDTSGGRQSGSVRPAEDVVRHVHAQQVVSGVGEDEITLAIGGLDAVAAAAADDHIRAGPAIEA